MDILRKNDADLAALYNACCVELRRRASAAKCDDVAIIRGNEMGKRALTVGCAGNHSILFIGEPNSGKSMFRAAAIHHIGPVTFEARPCPCGYYGSARTPCNCTAAQVERHRAKLPVADITIEIVPPAQRDLQGRPGTCSADLSRALADVAQFTGLDLCEECRNLLKAACAELNIDADAQERIKAVARTIANMDRSETIKPSHLCEAINYRAILAYRAR
jgi:predicted ATPase with chaperone activity